MGFYERESTKGRIKEKHIKGKEELKTRKTNEHTKRTEKVKDAICVRNSRDRGMEKEGTTGGRKRKKAFVK